MCVFCYIWTPGRVLVARAAVNGDPDKEIQIKKEKVILLYPAFISIKLYKLISKSY